MDIIKHVVPEIKPQISTELNGVKCCNCCFRRAKQDDDIVVVKKPSKQQIIVNNVIMYLKMIFFSFSRNISD